MRRRILFAGLALVIMSSNLLSQVQKIESVERQIRYLVYIPDGYNDTDTADWPLLVFLHGSGERGTDIEKVKVHGPPKLVEQGENFPFIIVSPQCPEGEWWKPGLVVELIEKISASYPVDRSRIYLTGLSMGGYGTWETAIRYPEIFAAIAPVCGGGNPDMVHSITTVPVWNFHGAKDNVVPVTRSDEMVEALRKAGGEVKYTVYPDATHDSWTETYSNPELYQWLLSKRKK